MRFEKRSPASSSRSPDRLYWQGRSLLRGALMKRVTVWSGAMIVAVAFAAILSAQAPLLDVKMGLWEMTSVVQMSGDMPKIDTSKMSPEQKAQVDQMMKSAMGSHTSTEKSCITKEKLEKSSFMMGEHSKDRCKHTVTVNTKTTYEAALACSGEHPMTGKVHFDAMSPTAVKGTITSDATTPQGKMNVNAVMTGKWLGAD